MIIQWKDKSESVIFIKVEKSSIKNSLYCVGYILACRAVKFKNDLSHQI